MKYFLFAALVLLSSLLAFPIELAPSWRNYRIDGRQLTVFAQHQSPSGMVWLGCDGGLYAFDGFSARPVRTESGEAFGAQVYAIVPRPDGLFWLGTNNGLYTCDPDRMTVTPVQRSVSEVRALALCGSTLYIGTLGGLYAFDTASSRLTHLQASLPHDAVYALLAAGSAPDADLYIGTYDGLCRLAPGERRVSSFRPPAEIPPGRNFFVNAIVPGPTAGTLTLGVEGALMFFNTRTAEFTPVPAYSGQSVKDIAYTARGEMVVATDNGLLLAPDLRHPEIFTVCRHDASDPSSIADNTVWSLSVSRGGQIFAGTAMGLSVGETDSPVRTVQLSEITGRNDGQQIYSILRDNRGRLWLGGNNGLIGV